ncbi:MAG TPA: hypothetical protein VG167_09450 [Verrucomicrobiae bacterium]|nr:hypothetical protein [Verrucomicrobiae bacterium]
MTSLQRNQGESGGVTLIELLSLFAGVAGCSGAVLAGKNAGHYVVGWIIGMAIGFASCSAVWKWGKWVIYRLGLHGPEPSPFRFILSWIFLLVVIVWVVASAFIGFWITRLVAAR